MSCTKLTLVASEFRIVFGNYGLQASVLVFTESKNILCWWEYYSFHFSRPIFPQSNCLFIVLSPLMSGNSLLSTAGVIYTMLHYFSELFLPILLLILQQSCILFRCWGSFQIKFCTFCYAKQKFTFSIF